MVDEDVINTAEWNWISSLNSMLAFRNTMAMKRISSKLLQDWLVLNTEEYNLNLYKIEHSKFKEDIPYGE